MNFVLNNVGITDKKVSDLLKIFAKKVRNSIFDKDFSFEITFLIKTSPLFYFRVRSQKSRSNLKLTFDFGFLNFILNFVRMTEKKRKISDLPKVFAKKVRNNSLLIKISVLFYFRVRSKKVEVILNASNSVVSDYELLSFQLSSQFLDQ